MEYPDDVSESDTASSAADLKALRALQAEVSELERIEELLERYRRSGGGLLFTISVENRETNRKSPLSIGHYPGTRTAAPIPEHPYERHEDTL
jgi:hypothetical protein